MHLKSYFLALIGVSLVTASFTECGSSDPTESQLQIARKLHAIEKNMTRLEDDITKIDIDVYFHVITNSIGLQNGQLSSDQLIRQLNVLNNAFNPINITFNLAGSNTFAPLHWYGGCGNDDEMERLWYKLHKGTYADLNVYSVPNILCVRTSGFFHRTQSWSISGYVHDFPTDVSPGALKESYDGVTISADTVPGGSLYRSNKGMTLVHEVGHWLGLFHTFQGGCEGEGDLVDDMPAESMISNSCDHGRDSCRFQPGTDPVENYMNYSEDSCLKEFTPGQVKRMFYQWAEYRAKHQKHAHKGQNPTISAPNSTKPHIEEAVGN